MHKKALYHTKTNYALIPGTTYEWISEILDVRTGEFTTSVDVNLDIKLGTAVEIAQDLILVACYISTNEAQAEQV